MSVNYIKMNFKHPEEGAEINGEWPTMCMVLYLVPGVTATAMLMHNLKF